MSDQSGFLSCVIGSRNPSCLPVNLNCLKCNTSQLRGKRREGEVRGLFGVFVVSKCCCLPLVCVLSSLFCVLSPAVPSLTVTSWGGRAPTSLCALVNTALSPSIVCRRQGCRWAVALPRAPPPFLCIKHGGPGWGQPRSEGPTGVRPSGQTHTCALQQLGHHKDGKHGQYIRAWWPRMHAIGSDKIKLCQQIIFTTKVGNMQNMTNIPPWIHTHAWPMSQTTHYMCVWDKRI